MVTSLLPPNATKAERDIEAVLSPPLSFPIRDLWNPRDCPESLLPWLAWSLSVDPWDSSWPVDRKRRVIADSIYIHRCRGTRDAVERALQAIRGDGAEVVEWFEDPDNLQPGEFRVDLQAASAPVDESTIPALAPAIASAKNVRSHLRAVTITSRLESSQKHLAVSRQGRQVKSGAWVISSMISNAGLGQALIARQNIQIKSGPIPLE